MTSRPFGKTRLTNGTSVVCLAAAVFFVAAACVAFAVCAKLTLVKIDKIRSELRKFFYHAGYSKWKFKLLVLRGKVSTRKL